MSATDTPIKKPSEELAELVLNRLDAKKLVLSSDVERATNKLADGKLKAEDWRVLIEKAMDKESEGE